MERGEKASGVGPVDSYILIACCLTRSICVTIFPADAKCCCIELLSSGYVPAMLNASLLFPYESFLFVVFYRLFLVFSVD